MTDADWEEECEIRIKEYFKKVKNKKKSTFPDDAHSFEVFAIKDNPNFKSGKEAYIGYKRENGDFHFIQVPYTGDK